MGERDGFLRRILIASGLIRNSNVREQIIDMSIGTAKGVVLFDELKINIEGPGITDEDRKLYEKSVANISERVFYSDGAVNDEIKKRTIEAHKRLVESLRIKQEAAIQARQDGIPPRHHTSHSQIELNALHTRTSRERIKSEDKARRERQENAKPWYKRNYD